MFRRCEASGGPKGQKVFHNRIKSFHVFQFRVRFPAALQKKALAVTRCNGIILKIFLGFLASKCRTAFSGENRSKAFEWW